MWPAPQVNRIAHTPEGCRKTPRGAGSFFLVSRLFIGTLAGVIVMLPSVISVFRLLPAALPLLWRLFRKSVRLLCLCPKLSRPNRLGTARRAILLSLSRNERALALATESKPWPRISQHLKDPESERFRCGDGPGRGGKVTEAVRRKAKSHACRRLE